MKGPIRAVLALVVFLAAFYATTFVQSLIFPSDVF